MIFSLSLHRIPAPSSILPLIILIATFYAPLTAVATVVDPSILTSATAEGPCTFVITTPVNNTPPLDFLIHIHPPSHTTVLETLQISHIQRPGSKSFHPSLSRLRQTMVHAFHKDFFHSYHHVSVNLTRIVSLLVRASSSSHSTTSLLDIHVTVHPRTLRAVTCPNVIPQDTPETDNDLTPTSLTPRIINGYTANPNLRQYLVSFLTGTARGVLLCSGTLVSPSVAITAAHCEISPSSVAYLGSTAVLLEDGQRLYVRKFKTYSGFDVDKPIDLIFAYDIGYVVFQKPAKFPYKVMRVNSNASVPLPNSFVRSAGYGTQNPREGAEPDPKFNYPAMQVDSPSSPAGVCRSLYTELEVPIQDKRQVCAGFLGLGGCSACYGDSGGPLVQYDRNDEPVLVGVISSLFRCAHNKFPTIHIRTSAYIGDFLDAIPNLTLSEDAVAIFSSDEPIFSRKSLSVQVIIYIVLGCFAGIICIVVLAFVLRSRYLNMEEKKQSPSPADELEKSPTVPVSFQNHN